MAGVTTHPLLFDLGRGPTTRDVARLVKLGGVSALPNAQRRGDAATYQEIRCRSALNQVKGMRFFSWTLNPYRGCTHGCHYCFARRYQNQLELGAGDDFASVIFVKTNFVEVLRRELDHPAWTKETIGFGTATDPYQPIEGTYKLSRGVLTALAAAGNDVGIVTKGPMIVRIAMCCRTCRSGRRVTFISAYPPSTKRRGNVSSRAHRIPCSGCARCASSLTPDSMSAC